MLPKTALLTSHRTRKSGDPFLGRGIGGVEDHSQPRFGTGVDDDAAALALEHRHRELDHRKGRFEMAVHHAIPLLLGELVDRVAASQTRVVDQDVQAAEGFNRRVDRAPRAFHRDDAVGSRDRFAAGRADLIGDVRGRAAALRVATNIAHDDLGPLLGHQERLAASDSSAAAGDDRNPACQALITGLGHVSP